MKGSVLEQGGLSSADKQDLIDIANAAEQNDLAIRTNYADTINAKGVPATSADSHSMLIAKIGQLQGKRDFLANITHRYTFDNVVGSAVNNEVSGGASLTHYATITAGINGNSLYNGYAKLLGWSCAGAYTIMLKFRVTATTTDDVLCSIGKIDNGNARINLKVVSNKLAFSHCNFAGGGTNLMLPTTIANGDHKVAIVVPDSNHFLIYLNGVLEYAMRGGQGSDSFGIYIGGNGSYDYGYITDRTYGKLYRDRIDDVVIFNKALSQAEITEFLTTY